MRTALLALKTLDRVAPSAAVSLAEKLFRTPPRHKPSEVEREILSTGHRSFFRANGRKIAAWSWGDGPTVYLIHGWGGRGGQFHAFIKPLVESGFSVVLIDGPAHGQSEGKYASPIEFARVLRAAVEWGGPAHAIIGHSMGGASIALAIRDGLKVGRAVFIGTPENPVLYVKEFCRQLGLSERIKRGMLERISERFGVHWTKLSITEAAREMRTPLLVVHDRGDKEVAWNSGAQIAAHWPGAELFTTEHLGHRRILRSPIVVDKVTGFLKAEGAERPLTEGALDSIKALSLVG